MFISIFVLRWYWICWTPSIDYPKVSQTYARKSSPKNTRPYYRNFPHLIYNFNEIFCWPSFRRCWKSFLWEKMEKKVGPVHSGSVTSHPNLSIYRHCVDFRAPNKKESFLSNHFLSSGTINRKQKIFQKMGSQAGLLCIIIGWYCRILLNDLLDWNCMTLRWMRRVLVRHCSAKIIIFYIMKGKILLTPFYRIALTK